MHQHARIIPPSMRGGRTRRGTVAAGVALSAALLTITGAPAATAAPPTAEPFELVYAGGDAGFVCADVPVSISGTIATKLHDNGPGPSFTTGPIRVTITNLSTGDALTYSVSGPTFGERVFKGSALIFQPSTVGSPFVRVYRGSLTLDENGVIDMDSVTGTYTDVCAEIT